MIALVTPTGNRPRQIELCARWMKNQDYKDNVLWIIIDDCNPRTTDFISDTFRENWTIKKVYPKPAWQEGQNTQGRNLASGIKEVKKRITKAIFIIEDDDYYKPCYLSEMVKRIKGFDIAGEINTIYYNVNLKRWIENKNGTWSSLFQTAFTSKAIPLLEKLYNEKFIDLAFFHSDIRANLFEAGKLSIGIKGQPGRSGIGAGHRWSYNMHADLDSVKLKELIGEDSKYYL